MKLLLDTHVFIWWASEPTKLSPQALALCQDEANELILSVASVWEMQIKVQLGKLKLALSLRDLVTSQQQTNGLIIMGIDLAHVFALQGLPLHHSDPFDRLLIAQAIVENAVLLSVDRVFARYPVPVLR